MSFNRFNRTQISKTVGWDSHQLLDPTLSRIQELEKDLDSLDPEKATKAMVQIFEFYRFMNCPVTAEQEVINNTICRICRERLG